MGAIYRCWRHGDLTDNQLKAGIYALKEIRETLVASDLDRRITELEGPPRSARDAR